MCRREWENLLPSYYLLEQVSYQINFHLSVIVSHLPSVSIYSIDTVMACLHMYGSYFFGDRLILKVLFE